MLEAALLQLTDIHTYYGDSHVLQGVTFDVAQGQRHRRAGPQRRRQDDDVPDRRRVHAGAVRPRGV